MKYVSVENVIFVCIIAGFLTTFAGMLCHNLVALCIGLFVFGIVPMLLAEFWDRV